MQIKHHALGFTNINRGVGSPTAKAMCSDFNAVGYLSPVAVYMLSLYCASPAEMGGNP